jgi:hypothetical protein
VVRSSERFSLQPEPLTSLENLDALLIKGKRACYTVVICGLYQHFAGTTIAIYTLQEGTNI